MLPDRWALLAIATSAFVVCACVKKVARPPSDPDRIRIDLPIRAGHHPILDPELQKLLTRLAAHKTVSFKTITELLIRHQLLNAPGRDVSENSLHEWVQKITPPIQLPRAKLKLAYEANLESFASVPRLIYNRDKINIVDVMLGGRLQCYSGTYLYELVRRQIGAQTFAQQNEVVIFQKGHMLPGYMLQTSGRYRLIGIETTQNGGGRLWLGPANALTSAVRVVDAQMFAVIELLHNSFVNLPEVASSALKQTAELYGIPLDQIADVTELGQVPESTKLLLNGSPFAFGESDIPPGDQQRSDSADTGEKQDGELGEAG